MNLKSIIFQSKSIKVNIIYFTILNTVFEDLKSIKYSIKRVLNFGIWKLLLIEYEILRVTNRIPRNKKSKPIKISYRKDQWKFPW